MARWPSGTLRLGGLGSSKAFNATWGSIGAVLEDCLNHPVATVEGRQSGFSVWIWLNHTHAYCLRYLCTGQKHCLLDALRSSWHQGQQLAG